MLAYLKKIVPNGIKQRIKPHLLSVLRPRRFHAYCVGTAKSATSSVHSMLKARYRSDHEPEDEELIKVILSVQAGSTSPDDLAKFVRQRDKRMWLEMDSSNLNCFILRSLVEAFPEAKFLLTIRDCYSWLDSQVNHMLYRPVEKNSLWPKIRDLRFGIRRRDYPKEEQVLAENNLYALDGYLSYWTKHNTEVLKAVPRQKLLIIRTHEFTGDVDKIVKFLGIPGDTINRSKTHENKARRQFNILNKIDKEYLRAKVEQHCQALMDEFFPDYLPTEGVKRTADSQFLR